MVFTTPPATLSSSTSFNSPETSLISASLHSYPLLCRPLVAYVPGAISVDFSGMVAAVYIAAIFSMVKLLRAYGGCLGTRRR